MLLSQRHHGQMNRGKFPLHFKGYLLYTAATQNTKWYSLTLKWMLSNLQILVVKRGFLLSIDKINTKQSRKLSTTVAYGWASFNAKTAHNSGLQWMDQRTYQPIDLPTHTARCCHISATKNIQGSKFHIQ